MVETAFPWQRAMWECLWESINQCLLNRPFPWDYPSCFPTEYCVVEGTMGDVVCLSVLLAGSSELSPSPL